MLNRRASEPLKRYEASFSNWLHGIRNAFSSRSKTAQEIQHSGRNVLVNFLLIVVLIGIGTSAVQFVGNIATFTHLRPDILGLLISFLILVLCVPPLIAFWHNLRLLIDETIKYLLSRRSSARALNQETLHTIIRSSIMVPLSILLAIWSIPLIISLLSLGSFAIAAPIILLSILIYFLSTSVRNIHSQLETTFRTTLFGHHVTKDEEVSNKKGENERK